MPQTCTVCAHPDVILINEQIVGLNGKSSNRAIASQYSVDRSAVQRHRAHLPELLVQASQAAEVAQADDLLDQVRDLQRRALAILDAAEETGELGTALRAIAQARGNLELLGKLAGELQQAGTVNIQVNPQWLELRAVIITALAPYEQAQRAVLRALEGGGNGRTS